MSTDQLAQVRAKAAELRDVELEIEVLAERLTTLNKKQYAISHDELPKLMMDAGIKSLELDASGNQPAYTLKLQPFYQANIAAAWDTDRRTSAFKYLEGEGAGDLIKTEIVIALPREQREEAKKLIDQLAAYGPQVKENVHTGTLTAWLREQSESGNVVDLEVIGGTVGMIAKPKKTRSTTRKAI